MPFAINDNETGNTKHLNLGSFMARGRNVIDFDLIARYEASFNAITLYEGSSIRFTVYASKDTDSFRAGYYDPNGKTTFINSTEGGIIKTFVVPLEGLHTVYFYSLSDNDIHLKGEVQITY